MADRSQIDQDAQYFLDEFKGTTDPDHARRSLNAFLGELYRLYCSVWPEKKARNEFFDFVQSRDDYAILDTLTMLVRGGGVHDLTMETDTSRDALYPGLNVFPSPNLFPRAQFSFPIRDPRMGEGERGSERRQAAYDRLIVGTPVLRTIEGALVAIRTLASDPARARRLA